jgi:hypothetical protein
MNGSLHGGHCMAGVLRGRRVVRGRERECLEYYRLRGPHRRLSAA